MHVAALSGQSGIIRILIKTIKNVHFIRRLYVNDTEEQTQQRIQFILDMYLNTPDKMVNGISFCFIFKILLFSYVAKRNSITSCIEIRTL
jgi:hypothetical protein